MQRRGLLIIGLILIAIAAAWFLTPVSDFILARLEPAQEIGERGEEAPPVASSIALFNAALNALNTLIAAIGIFLTARGIRR